MTTTQATIKGGAKFITITKPEATFSGKAGECWEALRSSQTVAEYMANAKASLPGVKLRFYLRHFVQTVKVAELHDAPAKAKPGRKAKTVVAALQDALAADTAKRRGRKAKAAE